MSSTSGIKSSPGAGEFGTLNLWHADATVAAETGTVTAEIRESGAYSATSASLTASITAGTTYIVTSDSSNALNAATYAAATAKAHVNSIISVTSTKSWTLEKFSIVTSGFALSLHPASGTPAIYVYRMGILNSGDNGVRCATGTPNATISNCFAIHNAGVAIYEFRLNVASATFNIYHCSGYSNQTGGGAVFSRGNGTMNTYACIAQGAGTCWSGTIGGTRNVSQDATAPGSNSVRGASGLFAVPTAGSEDLNLNCRLAMVDETGFPADCATDLVGTSRPATLADPGCVQWVGTYTALTTLTSDEGTGSAGTAINGRTTDASLGGTGHTMGAPTGANQYEVNGSGVIQQAGGSGSGTVAYDSAASATGNQSSEVVMDEIFLGATVMADASTTDSNSYFAWYASAAAGLSIYKSVAGAVSLLAVNAAAVPVAGDTISIEVQRIGSTNWLTSRLNGVLRVVASDTALSSGVGGYRIYNTGKIRSWTSKTIAAGSSWKTWNGLAIASLKTRNGLAIASVKTWNSLA